MIRNSGNNQWFSMVFECICSGLAYSGGTAKEHENRMQNISIYFQHNDKTIRLNSLKEAQKIHECLGNTPNVEFLESKIQEISETTKLSAKAQAKSDGTNSRAGRRKWNSILKASRLQERAPDITISRFPSTIQDIKRKSQNQNEALTDISRHLVDYLKRWHIPRNEFMTYDWIFNDFAISSRDRKWWVDYFSTSDKSGTDALYMYLRKMNQLESDVFIYGWRWDKVGYWGIKRYYDSGEFRSPSDNWKIVAELEDDYSCTCHCTKTPPNDSTIIFEHLLYFEVLVQNWFIDSSELREILASDSRTLDSLIIKEIDKYYRDFLEKAKWKRLDIVKLLSCLEDNIDTTNIMADINKRYGDKKYFLQHVREIRNMLESFSYLKENSLE